MFEINPHLSDQFSQQPQTFVSLLKKYWNQTYSALFVFQFQPLKLTSHCGTIYAMPTIGGKGAFEIQSFPFSLKQRLEAEFHVVLALSHLMEICVSMTCITNFFCLEWMRFQVIRANFPKSQRVPWSFLTHFIISSEYVSDGFTGHSLWSLASKNYFRFPQKESKKPNFRL
jgi:hypothetical protein